ncbi:MAG: hypothetical protein JWR64_1351, partial [Marmoricola sp.]|nr:hypothetical protein [Marmoricola sp.]
MMWLPIPVCAASACDATSIPRLASGHGGRPLPLGRVPQLRRCCPRCGPRAWWRLPPQQREGLVDVVQGGVDQPFAAAARSRSDSTSLGLCDSSPLSCCRTSAAPARCRTPVSATAQATTWLTGGLCRGRFCLCPEEVQDRLSPGERLEAGSPWLGSPGLVASPEISRDVVREGGVEPPRPFGHTDLNRARLPIPPLARAWRRGATGPMETSTRLQGSFGARPALTPVMAPRVTLCRPRTDRPCTTSTKERFDPGGHSRQLR